MDGIDEPAKGTEPEGVAAPNFEPPDERGGHEPHGHAPHAPQAQETNPPRSHAYAPPQHHPHQRPTYPYPYRYAHPYPVPPKPKVPLPRAPGWLPVAVLGVGVVAALLGSLNRPGIGLVITGVVAGLTALCALMVRPAIPESALPGEGGPEAEDEDAEDAPADGIKGTAPQTAETPGAEVTGATGAAPEPRPDRYSYAWSAIFGVLAAVLLSTAAFRDAGWVLLWTLTGAFLPASLAFAVRNPASRRNAVSVATGAFALFRNAPSTPRFLLTPLRNKRGPKYLLPVVITTQATLALLLVFGILFALADQVFAAYLVRMFTSVDSVTIVFRPFGMALAMLFTGAAVLAARRHHARPTAPATPGHAPATPDRAPAQGLPVWVWTIPLGSLVALFTVFVGVQAAVMFAGDDYVQQVAGVSYAEYARQGFFQLVVVSVLVLGVVALATYLLPSRPTATRTLRNVLLGLLCVLTLVILASAMMRLQLYIGTFGLTRLRVTAEAWILWSAGVFGLVLVAGALNTFGRSAAWLPRVTVAFAAAALAVFAYSDPDLRIAESHQDLDLSSVDTRYLRGLSADAVPGLMGLEGEDRDCALLGLRDRLDDPDGRKFASWNLSRYQGRQQLAELGLFNTVDQLQADCSYRYEF